jgi:hypothetical protein
MRIFGKSYRIKCLVKFRFYLQVFEGAAASGSDTRGGSFYISTIKEARFTTGFLRHNP